MIIHMKLLIIGAFLYCSFMPGSLETCLNSAKLKATIYPIMSLWVLQADNNEFSSLVL